MLKKWVISRLERVKERSRVVIIDPHHLLSQTDEALLSFADKNGFIVIIASTNLVFRELYEHARNDPVKKKRILIDQTPSTRRIATTSPRAPPLFYPDFIDGLTDDDIINLDLQLFLKDQTGDPNWPKEANDKNFARVIVRHLKGVLEAHKNLQIVDKTRFTDQDFHTIIAFAALGLGDVAFKKLESGDYWKIVFAHDELKELEHIAPEVLEKVKENLEKAPKPFCWFAHQDPESVINGLYLSAILSQHTDEWKALTSQIEPEARRFSELSKVEIHKAAEDLVKGSAEKADLDLAELEDSLSRDVIDLILVESLKIQNPDGFYRILEKENYSILFRSLALLMATSDALSAQPSISTHKKIQLLLFNDSENQPIRYVDNRTTAGWSHLKEAYGLATEIHQLNHELTQALKVAKAAPAEKLDLSFFWETWNTKRLNRLEYYLSRLERIVHYGDDILLHRSTDRLPKLFGDTITKIKDRVRDLNEKDQDLIDELNVKYQNFILKAYPGWVKGDPDVVLTSQFITRCLKPNWDPVKEDAVVMIFDGMRYDIWDEMLRPLLLKSMNEVCVLKGSSLLPSETHISRKAIAAGTFPDSFNTAEAENKLFKESLKRELDVKDDVIKVDSSAMGIGETVRYRTGRLDIFIWDLCDEELHKIKVKDVGGRLIPDRPFVLIYQQHLRDIIEREVMAVIRQLKPGTKVFITADHGFGRVGRHEIWFKEEDVPEQSDCRHSFCMLRYKVAATQIPLPLRQQIIEFTPADLRLPVEVQKTDRFSRTRMVKKYGSIAFPRPGYAFGRDHTRFDPPAFSHGGVTMQEMFIPMVVLQVKERSKDLIEMQFDSPPKEVVEGEEVLFRLRISHTGKTAIDGQELPISFEASFSRDPEKYPVPSRMASLSPWSQKEVLFRFTPSIEEADLEERKAGQLKRYFTVTARYKEGGKTVRRPLLPQEIIIKLNSERIVRRVGALGNILGLTPKGESKPLDLK